MLVGDRHKDIKANMFCFCLAKHDLCAELSANVTESHNKDSNTRISVGDT